MIEIDALGRDGRSILIDLQGASPTGGFVTSDSRPCHLIAVGNLIRRNGWSVVAGVVQDGVTGECRMALIGAEGDVTWHAMWRGQSAEVRTDAMINPDTLYKLRPAAAPGPGEAGRNRTGLSAETMEILVALASTGLAERPDAWNEEYTRNGWTGEACQAAVEQLAAARPGPGAGSQPGIAGLSFPSGPAAVPPSPGRMTQVPQPGPALSQAPSP